jgi:hypothetical protein
MWAKLHQRFNQDAPRYLAWVLIGLWIMVLWNRYPASVSLAGGGPPTDFAGYLKAWMTARAGGDPYIRVDLSSCQYAPGILALAQLLPKSPDKAWFIYSAILVGSMGVGLLAGARYRSWKSIAWLTVGLGLSWKGILESLDFGQPELLIFALAIFAAAILRRFPIFSGFLAGTLPWFRLPWALLFLPLILRLSRISLKKRGRLFVSGYYFSWFIWGAAIPSLVFGPERAQVLSHSWLEVLKSQLHGLYFSDINQSLWVFGSRWVGGGYPLTFGFAAIFLGLLLGFLVTRVSRGRGDEVWSWISPWLILVQLIYPLSWRWGSACLIGVPFAIATSRFRNRGFQVIVGLAVLGFWLIQMNPVVKALGYSHWSDLHGYSLVTFYWLGLLLLSL